MGRGGGRGQESAGARSREGFQLAGSFAGRGGTQGTDCVCVWMDPVLFRPNNNKWTLIAMFVALLRNAFLHKMSHTYSHTPNFRTYDAIIQPSTLPPRNFPFFPRFIPPFIHPFPIYLPSSHLAPKTPPHYLPAFLARVSLLSADIFQNRLPIIPTQQPRHFISLFFSPEPLGQPTAFVYRRS